MVTMLGMVWCSIELYTLMNLYITVEMLLHNLSHLYCVHITGVAETH